MSGPEGVIEEFFSTAFDPPIFMEFVDELTWQGLAGPEPYREHGLVPPVPDPDRNFDLIGYVCIPVATRQGVAANLEHWKMRLSLRVIKLNQLDEIDMMDLELLEELVESEMRRYAWD